MPQPTCTWERMNTHETMSITVEILGQTLRLAQDPNTEHLGTTVWDASIVLAKMLEKNQRKGDFSRAKIEGKRVVELGAGMGLGGIAMAMLGADVTLTDTVEVLPLLKRNCEVNLGVGKVKVAELDWMQPAQVAAFNPPVDFIIAADCIYHENIVPHFHRTVMDLTSHKTTVLVVNELRSQSVHKAFMEAFTVTHTVKRMPASKLDEMYQHPLIEVYVCKKKRGNATKDGGKAEEGEDEAPAIDDDAAPSSATGTASQAAGAQEQHGESSAKATGQASDEAAERLQAVDDDDQKAQCSEGGVVDKDEEELVGKARGLQV